MTGFLGFGPSDPIDMLSPDQQNELFEQWDREAGVVAASPYRRRGRRHRHGGCLPVLAAATVVLALLVAVLLLTGCKDPGASPVCRETDPKTHKCIVWEGRT